ncbi:hypothetical protein DL766_000184 [Monosporascus sp. MC13-8B]|nr:hypothetical protein DL763_011051 [Monosporascus cannonballus]RYP39742.1 hypothetical protein DL766_000184 [Monosporascus sp. MC13-8B]
MYYQVHQPRVEVDYALLRLGRVGQRPEAGPGETERHRAEDPGLAPVRAVYDACRRHRGPSSATSNLFTRS